MFSLMPSNKIKCLFGLAVINGFNFDFKSTINYLPAFASKLYYLIDATTKKKFLLSATL